MTKKSIFIISLFLLITSCSKKNKDMSGYEAAAQKIISLSQTYSEKNDSRKADYFIAEVQEVIEAVTTFKDSDEELRLVPVTVKYPEKGSIANKLDYLGDIQAYYSIKVYSKMPDRIEKFYVNEGDFVKAGTPLAQINNDKLLEGLKQAESAKKSAEIQFNNIDDEFKRMEKLYSENALSLSQFEQIKTQRQVVKNGWDQAVAAYNTMKSQVDDALVTAPIDGYVTNKNFEEGDMSPVQIPLLTISQMQKMKIIVNVIEKEIGLLKLGMPVDIDVAAYPEQVFRGKINKIAPTLNPGTRTGKIEININNPLNILKPGMFAKIHIIAKRVDNAILLDKYLIKQKTSTEKNSELAGDNRIKRSFSVFVIEDSMAVEKQVNIGIISEEMMQILSGLTTLDKVIDLGRNNVKDSTLVKIVD